jgi:hypothetical protein
MRWYRFGNNTSRTHQRPGAYCNTADYGAVCANCGTIVDQRFRALPIVRTFAGAIWVDRPRAHIVGETDMGTHEDAIPERHAVKYGHIVLNLDAVANVHAFIDEYTASDYTLGTDTGAVPDVHVVPQFAHVSDRNAVFDERSWMNEVGHRSDTLPQVLVNT